MKLISAFTSFLFCFSYFFSAAQSTESLKLDSIIHKKIFHLNNGHFSGEGWEILKSEVKKAQIVLIGEDHGYAEVPVFTANIADAFKPNALVAEIDPYLAIQLKKMSPDPTKYRDYLRKRPYGFSFYSWQPEMDLMTKMTKDGVDIWGLNELNFLSIGNFFSELADQAKNPKNKALARKKDIEYTKNDRPIFEQMDTKMNDFSAYHLKVATIDTLISAFKNENKFSQKLLNDLRLSIPIFANTDGQFRVNFMKKNLLNYLSPYIKDDAILIPKLLFKFGANHVPRTANVTGYQEVGNLASNLAEAAGKTSLHILIIGKQGTVNVMAPIDNTKAIQPYNINESIDLKGLSIFCDQLKDDEWGLFDLAEVQTAIRKGKIKIANSKLKGMLLGYDLLVMYAKTTGSKFIE